MLPRIIGLINTTLQDILQSKQQPTIPLSQIEIVYGNRAIEFNSVTPRIIWTFGKDRFTPTKHLGVNPHQGKSMESEVYCHVFHKSPDDVYFLVNDIVAATRITLCEPSIISASGEMLDPGENSQNGYGYRLSLVLDVTILDPGLKYIQIKTVDAHGEFVEIQPQL
ncbi:MAG: hypothetical protein EKK57_11210 [Proteobacteria bacterium]|nr:MAG: hypothetical protein EKK57_11210 [Pseudomonadota bacterium]